MQYSELSGPTQSPTGSLPSRSNQMIYSSHPKNGIWHVKIKNYPAAFNYPTQGIVCNPMQSQLVFVTNNSCHHSRVRAPQDERDSFHAIFIVAIATHFKFHSNNTLNQPGSMNTSQVDINLINFLKG